MDQPGQRQNGQAMGQGCFEAVGEQEGCEQQPDQPAGMLWALWGDGNRPNQRRL